MSHYTQKSTEKVECALMLQDSDKNSRLSDLALPVIGLPQPRHLERCVPGDSRTQEVLDQEHRNVQQHDTIIQLKH